jgi:hypothetical protein
MIYAMVTTDGATKARKMSFAREQELHQMARGVLKGAKIKKLNGHVRSALHNKSMKSVWQVNTYLAAASHNL